MMAWIWIGYGVCCFVAGLLVRDWLIPIKPEPKRDAKGRFAK
jgi:hypothetical protein